MDKTQQWLAAQLGVEHSTVLRQEQGRVGVDDATFANIAKAYGITVAELSAHPSQRHRAAALDRLLRVVQQMDERGIRTLADLGEQLTKSSDN